MSQHDHELDRYLDGDVPIDQLSAPLRAEEKRMRALLGTMHGQMRAPASLRAAVMEEVAARPPSAWLRLVAWWLRPRTIRVSPAWATAALAAALTVFLLSPGSRPSVESPGAPNAAEIQVVTRFVLVAPDASSVQLTGDFASWSPEGIVMEDIRGTGVWTADVPLPPGVYQYTFIVNGTEWRPDPRAVSQVDDGFGQTNSVVIVSPESEA